VLCQYEERPLAGICQFLKTLFPSLIVQVKTPLITLVKRKEITHLMSGQRVLSSSVMARGSSKNHTSDRYLAWSPHRLSTVAPHLGKTLCFISSYEKADGL
jgi:hypothetical protein